MVGLEDVIDKLKEFDQLRGEAIHLRDGAMEFLIQEKKDAHDAGHTGAHSTVPDTDLDFTNDATVLAALQKAARRGIRDDRGTKKKDELLRRLKNLELLALMPQRKAKDDQRADRETTPDRSKNLPLFVAARVLQALVSTPGEGLSRAALCCYCRILRAFHTPGAPEFTTGGVSAGERAMSTAFMTGECVRALLALELTLRRTAEFFECIHDWNEARQRALDSRVPKAWQTHEQQRALSALNAELSVRRSELAFSSDGIEGLLAKSDVDDALLRREVEKIVQGNVGAFKDAFEEIKGEREEAKRRLAELKEEGKHHAELEMERSESAHLMAKRGIESGLKGAEEVREHVSKGHWKEASKRLKQEADGVRQVLSSPQQFLKSVLERELAQALSDDQHRQCDYPEMAFAAAGYGACRYGEFRSNDPMTEWDDPLLQKAARLLADRMGTDGLFPVGRPIVATPHGYHLEVIGAEVTEAVACVLRNAEVPFEPDVVRRMLRLFWDTRDLKSKGFGYERAGLPIEPFSWTTALCTLALDGIVRMLDETIRQEVTKHFTVRWPASPTLDELFYPDVGLAKAREGRGLCDRVQRIRNHLLGVKPKNERLWSIVLYGPPGTGKSTIAEALAASAKCPLFEITPSDLIVGGAEQVERRARIVFVALSMLSETVILFDEFDSVLKRRQPGTKIENIFEFLTPGMLPKLKKLHESAEERRAAYVLATNMVGDLDEAAIRDGRFDAKLGIYPPDLMSRTGRLISELIKVEGITLDDGALGRAAKVIHATAAGGMTRLGKRGWFTKPKRDPESKTPFYFIQKGKAEDCPKSLKAEKERPEKPEPENRPTDDSNREWQEWGLVNAWDQRLGSNPTWSDLQAALEDVPDLPPLPARNTQR